MRELLVTSVLALLAGATIIGLLQQGSGYVLISLGDISIEMSALVAATIYFGADWIFTLVAVGD